MQLLETDSNTAALRAHEADMSRRIAAADAREAAIDDVVRVAVEKCKVDDVIALIESDETFAGDLYEATALLVRREPLLREIFTKAVRRATERDYDVREAA